MPQLDLMTFFTQFFWFSVFFTFFYISILHFVIPSISLSLKFRKKRLDSLSLEINKKKENFSNLFIMYDNIILKTLYFSKNFIQRFSFYGSSWINTNLSFLNSSDIFFQPNKDYLKILSEKNFYFPVLNFILKKSPKDVYWTKLW